MVLPHLSPCPLPLLLQPRRLVVVVELFPMEGRPTTQRILDQCHRMDCVIKTAVSEYRNLSRKISWKNYLRRIPQEKILMLLLQLGHESHNSIMVIFLIVFLSLFKLYMSTSFRSIVLYLKRCEIFKGVL